MRGLKRICVLFLLLFMYTNGYTQNFNLHNNLNFTPNNGQFQSSTTPIKFAFQSNSIHGYLTENQMVFPIYNEIAAPKPEVTKFGICANEEALSIGKDTIAELYQRAYITATFGGANPQATWQMQQPRTGYSNYYFPHCVKGVSNATSYGKVLAQNLYEGIDAEYFECEKGGLKYNFNVKAGSDPKQIQIHWRNADSIKVDASGALFIYKGAKMLIETLPEVYQIKSGKKQLITCKYVCTKDNQIGDSLYLVSFQLGQYDTTHDLVIDPWITYFGGEGEETETRITSDIDGNIYLYGNTTSQTGISFKGYQDTIRGIRNNFVAKFNKQGVLLWATYIGGSDNRESIIADASCRSNIGITLGLYTQSYNYPVTNGSIQAGRSDIVVFRLNNAGQLTWSIYFGGNQWDTVLGLEEDNDGFVYITGYTSSKNLQGSAGTGTNLQGLVNAFLTKLNGKGIITRTTYYEGTRVTRAFELVYTGEDRFYIVGIAEDNNLTTGGFRKTINGVYDGLIMAVDTAGKLIWATYFGGSDRDLITSVSLDTAGGLYFGGYTESSDSINRNGWQSKFGGGQDGFVGRMDKDGHLLWSTYLGDKDEWDLIYDVRTDPLTNACIYGGISQDSTFPMFGCRGVIPKDNNTKQIIGSFDENGKPICMSFFEATTVTYFCHNRITLSDCRIFLAGQSLGNQNITANAYQKTFGGQIDAYVLSINPYTCKQDQSPPKIEFLTSPNTCEGVCNGSVNMQFTPEVCSFYDSVFYHVGNGFESRSGLKDTLKIKDLCGGKNWVALNAGCEWTDTLHFVVPEVIDKALAVHLGKDTFFCHGDSITLKTTNNPADAKYVWSTKSTNTVLTVLDSGTYWVWRETNRCETTDTIYVNKITPKLSFNNDTFFCTGNNINLIPNSNTDSLVWFDGYKGNMYSASKPGTYSAIGYLHNCPISDSLVLTEKPAPMFTLPPDSTLCENATLQLFVPNEEEVIWNNGSTDTTYMVTKAGTYWVVLKNECGSHKDTISVKYESCKDCHIFWPNSFSPNADGLNEDFKPSVTCELSAYKLSIYNRWGEKIFETNSYNQGWNGTYLNKECPQGLYNYTLTCKTMYKSERGGSGFVRLMR